MQEHDVIEGSEGPHERCRKAKQLGNEPVARQRRTSLKNSRSIYRALAVLIVKLMVQPFLEEFALKAIVNAASLIS